MTADELNLATSRLQLTPLTTQDVEAVWPGVSNPIVAEHMSWNAHRDKEETLKFLERVEADLVNEKSITWGVRCMAEFCGIFSIINILRSHRALRYDRGELAYWCSPKHQRRGIMTEAGRSVIRFSFTKLGLNRLVVGHHLNNMASQRLIERLGFKPIGIEHQAFMKGDTWIDIRIYELLARDYNPVG